MNAMAKILLYFPYRGVGGVSLLFKRLAGYLVGMRQVALVDFHDGFMGKSVPDGVELIDFDTVAQYPENAILVVQSLASWNIRDINKFPPGTRVLFWNLHPLNLFPYIVSMHSANRLKVLIAKLLMPLSVFRRRKLSHLVKYLAGQNALVFMDGENWERTAAFFPELVIPKRLLPILSPAGKTSSKTLTEELQCCWIGRIVDFKVHILIHLIKRLDEASSKVGAIKMTIVGDGDGLEFLKVQTASCKKIQLHFLSSVPPDALDEYIGNHVDILFAMGTSALEGASRGVPTFLLDYSYKPITGLYRFQYIFEAKDYSLGELIQEGSHNELDSTFEDRLLEIRSDGSKIRQSCYKYWLQHYSPDSVAGLFIGYADGTTATIGDLNSLGLLKCDNVSFIMRKLMRLRKAQNNIHGFLEN